MRRACARKDAVAPFRRRPEFPRGADGLTTWTGFDCNGWVAPCVALEGMRSAASAAGGGFRALRTFCVAEQAVSRMVGCAARGMQGERKAALHRDRVFCVANSLAARRMRSPGGCGTEAARRGGFAGQEARIGKG